MIDPTSEFRLLAALIDYPDYIFNINEKLFTDVRVPLFKAIKEAYLKYGEITHEGVEHCYGRGVPGELDAARGAKPEPIIDRLQSLQKKRQLAEISNNLNILLAQPDPTLDDIQRVLTFDIEGAGIDSSIQSGISEFISDFNQKRRGQYKFVRTGLRILDHMLGGEWGRKTLSVIIAQPGSGKTALICNSMLNMAMEGQGSLFISIEMPKDRVVSRLVAGLSETNNRDLRAGSVEESQMEAIDTALGRLQSLPLYIIHKTGITVQEIINQIRLHKEQYNIDAVFVDYLQIVGRDESDDVNVLGKITQALRDAAEKYDIACILLAQQNRMGEGQSSIFGSSKVAWIADNIIEIRGREGDISDDLRVMDIDAKKNREGPLGAQAIQYQPKYLRFLG